MADFWTSQMDQRNEREKYIRANIEEQEKKILLNDEIMAQKLKIKK